MISKQKFYFVTDVMSMLEIGETRAYKVIKQLNTELQEQGYITFAGRVSARYFDERLGVYQNQ